MKYCANCGDQLHDDSAFCGKCGHKVGSPVNRNTHKEAPRFKKPDFNLEIPKLRFRPLNINKTYLKWGAGIAVILILLIFQPFKNKNYEYEYEDNESTSYGESSNANETMDCPVCFGSGKYNSEDIFKSQLNCWGCGGDGKVTLEEWKQCIPSNTTPIECQACGGSGWCSTCIGHDRLPRNCGVCRGTGICSACKGYRNIN